MAGSVTSAGAVSLVPTFRTSTCIINEASFPIPPQTQTMPTGSKEALSPESHRQLMRLRVPSSPLHSGFHSHGQIFGSPTVLILTCLWEIHKQYLYRILVVFTILFIISLNKSTIFWRKAK